MARVLDAYLAHFGDAGGADAPHGSRRVTALMVAAANSGRDDARAAKRLLAAGAVDRDHEPCARMLLEMSDAALDGDFHRCVELARNGNWPVDGRVEARRGDDGPGADAPRGA
ncbi:hypothetical protein JL721_7096 [Aureococcus anophagefferens]|nr:hypothetical protein JL721_7096 [Aureococcus anophagefferens]